MNRTTPSLSLTTTGQSIWLDQISRSMLSEGELVRRVRHDHVRGVTSNPTIFAQAISGSNDYDEQLSRLASQGASVEEIYTELVATDIRSACEVLAPIYEQSEGRDGYVSVEVSPELAHRVSETIDEARAWVKLINQPNLLVKVPATEAGVAAFRQLTSEGISVNVTLIFSVERYRQIMQAYIEGLRIWINARGRPEQVNSVASFFVSRIDSWIDPWLTEIGTEQAMALSGKLAVANAVWAYREFHTYFLSDPTWARLASLGARIQRPLWASTSTKNPQYSPTLYVDELVAPHTVNTMPPETLDAYQAQGAVPPSTISMEDMSTAPIWWERLTYLANDHGRPGLVSEIFEGLETEGVDKFTESYQSLLADLGSKIEQIRAS